MPSVLAYSDPSTPFVRSALMSENNQGFALQARYTWRSDQGHENVLQASIDRDRSIHRGLWGSGTGVDRPVGQAPRVLDIGGHKTDMDVDFQQRRWGADHDFIWGFNLRHTSDNLVLPQTPYQLLDGKSHRLNYSAFVHDEITWVPDRLKWIVGSKFEKDGLTGLNVQPNVRVLYTPSPKEAYWGALSHSVRSSRRIESLGTVDINAQDAHELNATIPTQVLTAVTQVSPLSGAPIKAEQAFSLEGGWRKQFSNFLSVDTAFFVTRYSHLRGGRANSDSVSTFPQSLTCVLVYGPGPCYFVITGYNTNLDKARSYGGEISVEWHPRSWWKVQAAYSHLRVKGVLTGDMFGDSQVTAFENSAPRHQFSLHNNFDLSQKLNLDVRLRHNSETGHYMLNSRGITRVAPYTGLDVRLGWKVNRNTELSLLGRNLLQDRHTEFINIFPVTRAYDVQRSVLVQAVVRF